MITIIIITHGKFGEELFATAQSMVGKQEKVFTLTLEENEGLASLSSRVGVLLSENDGSGVLVLTDMLGGTPCNACLSWCNREDMTVISGVNLYMLISVCVNRSHLALGQLVEKAMADGKKSITNAKEMFLNRLM